MNQKKLIYLITTIIILSCMMPEGMANGADKTVDITIKMLKTEYNWFYNAEKNNKVNEVPGCVIDGKAYVKLVDSCIIAGFGYLAYGAKESHYIIVPSGFNWESASEKYGYIEIPRDKNKECGKAFNKITVKKLTIEFFNGDIKKVDGFVVGGNVYVKLADFVKLYSQESELKYDSNNKKYIVEDKKEVTEVMSSINTEEKDKKTVIIPTSTPIPFKNDDLTLGEQVVKLANEERVKEGLTALKINSALAELAAVRAKEISSLYSHARPDGTKCFDVKSDEFWVLGENIAIGTDIVYKTPESVMKGWMNSLGHKYNIMNPQAIFIGVGYYHGSDGYIYWVLLSALDN